MGSEMCIRDRCFFLPFFLSLSLSLSSLVIFLYEYTSIFTMNTKLRIDAAVDQTKNSTLLPMAHSTTVSSVTPISDIFYYSIPHLSRRAETSLSYTSPLPLLSLRSLTLPSKNRTHPRSRTSHKHTPSQRSRCKTSSQTLSPATSSPVREPFSPISSLHRPKKAASTRSGTQHPQRLRFWFPPLLLSKNRVLSNRTPRDDHHEAKTTSSLLTLSLIHI